MKLVMPNTVPQIREACHPTVIAAMATGTVTIEALRNGVRIVPSGVVPITSVTATRSAVCTIPSVFDLTCVRL